MATTRDHLWRFCLDGIRDTGTEIGRGSYAVVKELDFRGLKCAGKEIHSLLYEEAAPEERVDMLRRFEEECELLGRLRHPNVVQFLGIYAGANSVLPTLVMEYLPVTLSGSVDRHGVFPAEINLSILRDVALGLRYLHEHSPPVIHRDLSANNVLLTISMSAKISDLGVTKILDVNPVRAARMTRTQVPGTPSYMPLETFVARPKYTSKVDIFSLGVLMVHVLSGEWPIPSEGYAEDPQDPDSLVVVAEFDRRRHTMEKIENEHPLLGLIQQCLSNIPSRRPDAVEVVCQLGEVHSHVSLHCENRLELLQQVQSLRQSLGEKNEALRRENERLQAEIGQNESLQTEFHTKIQEVDTLRRNHVETQQESYEVSAEVEKMRSEIVSLQTERGQLRSQIESLKDELISLTQEYERDVDSLHSKNSSLLQQVQSLNAKLQQSSREEFEALRKANETLLAERRSKETEMSSMRNELEMIKAEMDSLQNRSRAESESLRSQIQRLTFQQRGAGSIKIMTSQCMPQWRLQWRRGRDSPEVITGTQAVVMGEKVCLDAGHKIYQYDWRRDTWGTLPDCSVSGFGMAQFLGRLITVGGRMRLRATGKVYSFNEEAKRWEESLRPMPTARYGLTVVTRAASPSKPPAIVACGGRSQLPLGSQCKVEVYCYASSQWYTAESLPISSCYQMTSMTINDTCYILGGSLSWNCLYASLDLLIANASSGSNVSCNFVHTQNPSNLTV